MFNPEDYKEIRRELLTQSYDEGAYELYGKNAHIPGLKVYQGGRFSPR